jgi:hypothetical protein
MPKTIQIRNVSDDLYDALRRRAAEDGMSVPDLLRREAERLVSRMSMKEWLERVSTRPTNYEITPEHVLEVFDEIRGPWPNDSR